MFLVIHEIIQLVPIRSISLTLNKSREHLAVCACNLSPPCFEQLLTHTLSLGFHLGLYKLLLVPMIFF